MIRELSSYELFNKKNADYIEEIVPTVIIDYLFKGYNLTDIEEYIFHTREYKGWMSKSILNFYGIATDGSNKGIYRFASVYEVIKSLNATGNKKNKIIADILEKNCNKI